MDDAKVAEHVGQIAAQGYTIVPNAIEPELLDDLNESLDRLEVDLGIVPADNDFEGRATTRIYNLLVHGDVFSSFPVLPEVLPIV